MSSLLKIRESSWGTIMAVVGVVIKLISVLFSYFYIRHNTQMEPLSLLSRLFCSTKLTLIYLVVMVFRELDQPI